MKRFITMLSVAALVLLILPTASLAQSGLGREVSFVRDISGDNRIFNPFRAYSGRLRYFIDPNNSYMTFAVNGLARSVNWDEKVEEAVTEWRQALSGTNLVIERVTDIREANVIISVEDNPTGSTAIELGGTIMTHGGNPTRVRFFRNGFEKFFNTQASTSSMGAISGDTPGLLNFLTRFTAKHELGHALGLADTDVRAPPLVRVPPTPGLPIAPIMTESPSLFIRRIYAQVNNTLPIREDQVESNSNQRQLTPNNITISPQEANAIIILIHDQQATCSSIVCIKSPNIIDD